MGAIVDYEYYSTVYMGTEADEASFPALCARACDVVGAFTRWIDPETLPGAVLTLYKKAVCSQVDYFAVNGFESVSGGNDRGFTVGKVSVSGKSGSDLKATGAMHDHISPLVILYLEQTGLLNPAVPVVQNDPFWGCWLC